MPSRDLTRRLGLSLPIIQAPMSGGVTTPDLVAAVSEAGGLGSLGAGYMSARAIKAAADAIRERTRRPFAINLFAPGPRPKQPSDEEVDAASAALDPYRAELSLQPHPQLPPYRHPWREQIQAVLEVRPAVFSFCFGVPEIELLDRLRERDIFLMGTATTVAEARLLEEADVDAIVAQGFEAGGHRATFTVPYDQGMIGLMALLPQMADAVDLPIIAAGGMMDGRAIAAALALGAAGAQLGTAFAACEESGFGDVQLRALKAAHEEGTALTRAFTGKAGRALKNRFMVEAFEKHLPVAPYPMQHRLTSDLRRAAAEQGRPDLLAIWAGQGVGELRCRSAQVLMAELARELEACLTVMGQLRRGWPER